MINPEIRAVLPSLIYTDARDEIEPLVVLQTAKETGHFENPTSESRVRFDEAIAALVPQNEQELRALQRQRIAEIRKELDILEKTITTSESAEEGAQS